jgi:anti-sigma regulatory factor (Ser/Thr protein kinase)
MAAPQTPVPRFGPQPETDSGWRSADGQGDQVARLHLQLRSAPEAAGEGRHALDRLDGLLNQGQLDELRLLVTELLTNSIRHGTRPGDWITLDVDVYATAVRVSVTDRGPGFQPRPDPHPNRDRPGGWGLCLVDRLADRWGVNSGAGTSVWFEIDRDRRFAAAA